MVINHLLNGIILQVGKAINEFGIAFLLPQRFVHSTSPRRVMVKEKLVLYLQELPIVPQRKPCFNAWKW